jgi:hypothetical protein
VMPFRGAFGFDLILISLCPTTTPIPNNIEASPTQPMLVGSGSGTSLVESNCSSGAFHCCRSS